MSHHAPGHHMPSHEEPMCSMNMLFTWDPTNLCVVFRWWHVKTFGQLILTLVAIIALSAGYECLRFRMRSLDNRTSGGSLTNGVVGQDSSTKLIKALGYAAQVGYSYMLMLIFMTYNGWAMLSVVVGAFLGYWFWGTRTERQMSCH